MPLEPGLTARAVLEVGPEDTAVALGSGEVAVLATPRLIALCEEASLRAVDGHVPEGHTTVGMRVQLDHLAPTAVGLKVTAEATLEKVEVRRLTFTVSANDDGVSSPLARSLALSSMTRRHRSEPGTWPMLAWGWAAWLVPLCSSVPSSQTRFVLGAWPAFLVADQMPLTREGRLVRVAAAVFGGALSLALVRRWANGAFIG